MIGIERERESGKSMLSVRLYDEGILVTRRNSALEDFIYLFIYLFYHFFSAVML